MNPDRISFALAILLALGIVAGILIPAGPGWDFANFYDAGHKILAGQVQDLYNPDVLIEGKAPEGHLAFYGTPLSALAFAGIAWMRPAWAMIAFKVQNSLAILLGLWLLYGFHLPLAQKAGLGIRNYRALFLAATVLFQPFWTIYRVGGQTTPTLFLGFVIALICLIHDRPLAAALCLVTVIAIKPAFVLGAALLVLMAGARFLLYTLATGAAAGALSIAAMGWSIHQRFLEHLASGKLSPWVYNSSISVMFDNLRSGIGPVNPWLGLGGTAVRLAAAVIVLVVLLRGRSRIASPASRLHFLFLMSVVFGLLLMPVVWEHYLSVLFIPVSYFIAMTPKLGRAEKTLIALVCLFCFTQNLVLVLWLNAHAPAGSVLVAVVAGLYKSAPLILFLFLLGWYQDRLVATYEAAL